MSARQVRISKVIKAKRWQVIRLITHVEEFPKFIPNLKQVSVLEKTRGGAVTCWSVEIEKIPISWKEKDTFDLKSGIVRFEAIEGDFENFRGQWEIRETSPGQTEVSIEVSFQIGIPLVENLIGDALAEKLKLSLNAMLSVIEDRILVERYKKISRRASSDINGFAVIGHPYNFNHLVRYFKTLKPEMKLPSREFIAGLFDLTPAYKNYDVKNFRSRTGKEVNGFLIMCPIIPDMVNLNPDRVVEKVVQACRVAEDLNVGIVSLGGFTSIVGERFGKSLTGSVNVPVTTGNTYTCALAIDGIFRAAEVMEIPLSGAKAVVIGGAGDIGSTCARVLSEHVSEITITGRNEKSLMEIARLLSYYGKARVHTSTDNNKAIQDSDIVLAAASTAASVIDFNNFKPGSVVCDVGYPKNISYTQCKRRDILIFSGGIAKLPTEIQLGFDIGMPSMDVAYGCFTEAVILALEERYENFSVGKGNITKERINFIRDIAEKHGFGLAPFFWGDRLLTDKDIEEVKENARKAVAK